MTSLSEKSINNSLTRSNAPEIDSWGMPDYTAKVEQSFGTEYTAASNGWLRFGGGSASGERNVTLSIDGSNRCQVWKSSTNTAIIYMVPISKGSVYEGKYNTGSSGGMLEFYPCQGG